MVQDRAIVTNGRSI